MVHVIFFLSLSSFKNLLRSISFRSDVAWNSIWFVLLFSHLSMFFLALQVQIWFDCLLAVTGCDYEAGILSDWSYFVIWVFPSWFGGLPPLWSKMRRCWSNNWCSPMWTDKIQNGITLFFQIYISVEFCSDVHLFIVPDLQGIVCLESTSSSLFGKTFSLLIGRSQKLLSPAFLYIQLCRQMCWKTDGMSS
jgi:hypothetical protein